MKATTQAAIAISCIFTISLTHAFVPTAVPMARIPNNPHIIISPDKIIAKRVFEIHSDKTEDSTTTTTTSDNSNNPLAAFLSLFNNSNNAATPVIETEEEKKIRLAGERMAELEELEVERQLQVKTDAIPYLLLLALQFLPLLGTGRIEGVTYFFGMAVGTVYIGGRQVKQPETESVDFKSALFAPIFASFSIGLLYGLIKLGLDPTKIYAFLVTVFGALAISDIGVPILRNLLPEEFASAKVEAPKKVAEYFELEGAMKDLPVDGLVTLAIGIGAIAAYWSPVPMESKFILSNLIAWAIGMVTLTSVSLGTFQTATVLLAGLFCYDIFWVFGTDVMMTVATKVEAPIKLLYPAPPPLEGATPREYGFSLLGLGDVVIPGLFVSFMGRVDEALKPEKISYFTVGTVAYAVGLATCFVVNEVTKAGQPALLYLDPACIGSALACAAANGQLKELWNFSEIPEEDEAEAEAEAAVE